MIWRPYDLIVASDALDFVALDRRVVELSVQIVSQAQPADLTRPTPCADWTLRDLLEHMTTQHYGFAAASRGDGADPQSWVQPRHEDPAAAYATAAEHVIAAFAEPGILQRSFLLPEIIPDLQFPAAQAISFHFVDYVVHGWDVARSLGLPFDVDDDIAAAGLFVARRVPDGPERLSPGAAFRPSVPSPPDVTAIDQVLTALGRSPAWPT
jgi:uncharacterized protein (TIGR03086 family)